MPLWAWTVVAISGAALLIALMTRERARARWRAARLLSRDRDEALIEATVRRHDFEPPTDEIERRTAAHWWTKRNVG